MQKIAEMTARMLEFNAGSPALSQHLIKVHAFARTIGLLEKLDAYTLETLELAALMHDIGIRVALEKYGHCTGPMQEAEGPPAARPLLEALGIDAPQQARVCYLIGHHHTYSAIDGIDYQILIEADFLVNIHEGEMDARAQAAVYANHFKTEAGKRLFSAMYPLVDA